jgi:pilus assembly protein CpaC
MIPLVCIVSAFAQEKPVIDVGVGASTIQREGRPVARVLISNPDVAELRLLEEGQYQVRGLAVGNTDLWVWFRDDITHPKMYRVMVSNDLSDVQRRIDATITDGAPPRAYAVRDRLVVEGKVADVESLERVASVARIYDEEFVNLVSVAGDQQVQLRVVFAEVSRTGMRELGINAIGGLATSFGGIQGPNSTEAFPASLFEPEDVPNINAGQADAPSAESFNIVGMVTGAVNIAAVLSVLEQYSLARTLAQPSTTVLSGQQAEMLVGGEIPIPISQFGDRIAIEFKEYGVKLVFNPTVMADQVIDMRAYVEVSQLDPANATRLSGIEIPALISRKGKSHLRLRDGMSFAMAGILDERTTATRAAVPLLGDIPIIGALFRYVKHERDETELVVFVTPRLVRPMRESELPSPPGTTEDFNPSDFQLFMMGQINQPGSRIVQPTGAFGMKR